MPVARIDVKRQQLNARYARFGGREERLMNRTLFLFVALTTLSSPLLAKDPWPATGKYEFNGWAGPKLAVYYSLPPKAGADSPILIIIPGFKHNTNVYKNQCIHLTTPN